jgi:hypothetical protein
LKFLQDFALSSDRIRQVSLYNNNEIQVETWEVKTREVKIREVENRLYM